MPALPLEEAGKYVAGAYVVFLTLILVYVAIIGAKVARIERDVSELLKLEESNGEKDGRSPSVDDGRDARRARQNAGLEAPRSYP